jgi:predicted short-subunit dehydrogenase-like oxidoreductase (DUF2520 family)
MKRPLPVGLLVEGNATASTLLRLPGLANQIGPVKSTALRVARRFSNALRAGHAVATYEELQESRLVLIRVPDDALERIVDEIRKSELILRRMCFAICETWAASTMFSELRDAGASVTTLLLVSDGDSSWFVAEGDLPAVRQARRLVENSGGRVLQLRSGCKSLYFAADLLVTTLPLPLLTAAQTSLRQAGLSGKLLSSVVNQLSNKLLRNLRAGPRMPSVGPLAAVSPTVSAAYLSDARDKLPEIGMLIDQHLSALQRKLN